LAANAFATSPPALSLHSLAGRIPSATHDPNDFRHDSLCEGTGRSANGSEEKAILAAGWIPFFAAQQIDSTRVVVGASSIDGSCRPIGLTVFVFRAGKPVGSVSGRDQAAIPTVQLNDAKTLIVSTEYRKPEDAHCCATGKAQVTVMISDQGVTAL
jgi:hypothetical protein